MRGILLAIERKLHEADRLAAARSLTLTDSTIRSLLVRAINEAKEKTAKSAVAAASDKDRFLAEVQQQLGAGTGSRQPHTLRHAAAADLAGRRSSAHAPAKGGRRFEINLYTANLSGKPVDPKAGLMQLNVE